MKSVKNSSLFDKKDLNKWYLELIKKSELFLYDDLKGFFYFDWYGLKIWERIIVILNDIFDQSNLNIKEIKTPFFFSKSELEKEKAHFSGFSPELYEIKNDTNLLVARPTSEILFIKYFKKKLFSYNDLPFFAGQWCSVFRKEKNNKAFFRTNEFFWYEGHGVLENELQVNEKINYLNGLFFSFFKNIFRLPFLFGEKTENEKFFGAKKTFSFEVLLPDYQFLQSTTVHNLTTNFSKSFSFSLKNQKNQLFHPQTISFGISTRIIGALVMCHGDEHGLVLPSEIAVYQVCFVIYWKFLDKEKITTFLNEWKYKFKHLFHIRFTFNSQEIDPFWFKKDCIIKGTCLFFEIGKQEYEKNFFTFFTRINFVKEKISFLDLKSSFIWKHLHLLNDKLWEKQNSFLNNSLKIVESEADFNLFLKEKLPFKIFLNWQNILNKDDFENKITSHSLSIRVITPLKIFNEKIEKKCFLTKKSATHVAIVGRSY